ncbi:Pex24p-domain-containing protein [Hyphopichia burtonii NRRL Y-1933]|uniref:Pex24p-domain-containing protein n=1 Tax=Hyphopichia burtonii NRRL Y-1933 TaxID=984485 RepID=A0A1E4RHG4_9ASCO|nr:Pex24p-domain-containing protein [Hyphopichia burtonii NRRL Y-1933]ODV66712.1 Pex24p-domain-containing protein [Hyphopichia burtonii NRRL Y-1933]
MSNKNGVSEPVVTEPNSTLEPSTKKSHSRNSSLTNIPQSPASTGNTDKEDGSTTEVRAQFTDESLVENNDISLLNKTKPQTSPLLSSTPPTVAKSLIKAYPYLLIVNKILSIVTWTNDDYWVNLIILSFFAFSVLYFESLVTWFGHLIVVAIITLYALLNKRIVEETNLHPTLDDVVQALTTTCIKADILLTPITSLSLTVYDIKRLLFTTVFLTPIYLIITFLMITPRTILLLAGIYIFTYHSTYLRVTRKMLWKIKLARLLCFYLTGLDFSQARNHSLFAAAFAKVQKNNNLINPLNKSDASNKPVRFTYVIYENQRRWLGIGWTSNLLSYERTPWTDEFLNESSSIESFQLPNPENNKYSFGQQGSNQLSLTGARWRWVDKTWRLDLTNDGAITLPNSKRSKTTANPSSDEGFIYSDNTWKKPSTDDSYSKYTRRRRWIRTAELVFDNSAPTTSESISPTSSRFSDDASVSSSGSTTSISEDSKSRKRKSLRFAEPDKPDLQDLSIDENGEDDEDVATLKESQVEPLASQQAPLSQPLDKKVS